MGAVYSGLPSMSAVRISEASASRRFLMYYLYRSFDPFRGACPLLGGSVMGGFTQERMIILRRRKSV